MARIRTFKPEYFAHEDIFELEQETGLPIRVAFAALWCQCDREGRFKWRPRRLKVACIPYDDCCMERVLDALCTRGFVVKYRVNDEWFGVVPGFKKHQVINNRESASDIPPPPDFQGSGKSKPAPVKGSDASFTRDERDYHATPTPAQGKGREGKGKEGEEPPNPLEGGTGDSDDETGSDPPKEKSEAFDPLKNVPEGINTAAWASWVVFRRKLRKRINHLSAVQQWEMLLRFDHEAQLAIINESIKNGWQGLFENSANKHSGGTHETGFASPAKLSTVDRANLAAEEYRASIRRQSGSAGGHDNAVGADGRDARRCLG